MTDDDGQLSGRERLSAILVLAAVAGLTAADVAGDAWQGGSARHIAVELLVIGGALAGLGWLAAGHLRVRRHLAATERSLERARADAGVWRHRHGQAVAGLARAIDEQFDAWQLTPAEKEVAFLLLKGLSFKETARVRAASERTVRQQALSVYAKSGVAGRAELSAFFLEDLLTPTDRILEPPPQASPPARPAR
jgi:DNA-binding CsgD family transcriptional regulator